ncbi:PIN domain-containing protein [Thermoflexus sp.]|uniref:type II toxin-antitoxin system VapC family toxin n=1 Tax=Thermoflexus sp. TaxID=1969742 RepID=UPI002A67A386|nr:PIN domain-containing protein [Thermoflexus sp.]MCS7158715.1 PIN domain-containing protein [Blastocatellia bacterium]
MNQESEATRPIFIFDTSVLIDYLRGQELAADAFARASEMGEVRLTIISLLELHLPKEEEETDKKGERRKIIRTRSKAEINDDLNKIRSLEKANQLQIMAIPEDVQRRIIDEIAAHHYPTLGKSLINDSLILACGFRDNVWLVTNDQNWFQLVRDPKNRLCLQVIRPEELVQAESLNDLKAMSRATRCKEDRR